MKKYSQLINKILNIYYRTILVCGGLGFLLLLLFLVINSQPDGRIQNLILLLLSITTAGVLLILYLRLRSGSGKLLGIFHFLLHEKRLILLYVIFFIIQLIIVRSILFYTNWDVGLIKWRVEEILMGASMQEINADFGYSTYPNNLLMFYLTYWLEKIGMVLKMKHPYDLAIYLSCLSVNISCYFGHIIVNKFTKSRFFSCLYVIISAVFILFSPWIVIPYTDTYGMFFVMLGFYALVRIDSPLSKWMVFAFASIIGYHIKPTCIFLLIAAFATAGIGYLLGKNWKNIAIMAVCSLLFFSFSQLIPVVITTHFSFTLSKDEQMTYTHFLMMGTNLSSLGGYNHDDYIFSASYPNIASREQANKAVFKRRINEYGWEGLSQLYGEKALLNFNDGTFSWGVEGNFYKEVSPNNSKLSELMKKYFYAPGITETSGKYYTIFRNLSQGIWIFILLGCSMSLLSIKKYNMEKACMMFALGGLFIFLMLFEARARYLYLYSPVLVILAVCGYQKIFQIIKKPHP